ncbi:MAG: hypothetical protein M1815_004074 [Lichina confinis]|nr:MAG: hypothetical protein M1815_004074 [Lichina confinis]
MEQVQESSNDAFSKVVDKLRAEYQTMRDNTNLFPPKGRVPISITGERVDGRDAMVYWFDDGTETGECVRIVDVPGKLSGDILRLHQNLPPFKGHIEIDGDEINAIENPSKAPEEEDDFEDTSAELALLPLIKIDGSEHFLKKGKYRSEIHNLLKCQGGSCPGEPVSDHVVQLLGKSPGGELVFKKLETCHFILRQLSSVAIYKSWILQIIAALKCLHSLGIVHRDLRIANLLFSAAGQQLVVCDLEGRWGCCRAPELDHNRDLEAGWTEKSDIYDIGNCIKGFVYANNPITHEVEWPVPPPFDTVVEACMRTNPQERPTLDELSILVEGINT